MLRRIEAALVAMRCDVPLEGAHISKRCIMTAIKHHYLTKWGNAIADLTESAESNLLNMAMCYRNLLANVVSPSYYFAYPDDALTEIAMDMAEFASLNLISDFLILIKARVDLELLIFTKPSKKREYIQSVHALLMAIHDSTDFKWLLGELLQLTRRYESWIDSSRIDIGIVEPIDNGVYYLLRDKAPELFPIKILLPRIPVVAMLDTESDLSLTIDLFVCLRTHIYTESGSLIPIKYLLTGQFLRPDNTYREDVPDIYQEKYLSADDIGRLEYHSDLTRTWFSKKRSANNVDSARRSLYTESMLLCRTLNEMSVKVLGKEEQADEQVYERLVEFYEFYQQIPLQEITRIPLELRGQIEHLGQIAGDLEVHGDGQRVNYGTCIDSLRRDLERMLCSSDPDTLMQLDQIVLRDAKEQENVAYRALQTLRVATVELADHLDNDYFDGRDQLQVTCELLESIDIVPFMPANPSALALVMNDFSDSDFDNFVANEELKARLLASFRTTEDLLNSGVVMSQANFMRLLYVDKSYFWRYVSSPHIISALATFNHMFDVRKAILDTFVAEIHQLILADNSILPQILTAILPCQYDEFIKINCFAFIIFLGTHRENSIDRLSRALPEDNRTLFINTLTQYFPLIFPESHRPQPSLLPTLARTLAVRPPWRP